MIRQMIGLCYDIGGLWASLVCFHLGDKIAKMVATRVRNTQYETLDGPIKQEYGWIDEVMEWIC